VAKVKTAAVTSAGTDGDQIRVPAINVQSVEIDIVGISSLIVHAWSEKAKGMMRDKQQKAARAPRAAKDPKADFEAAKYLNAEGKDCIPAGALRNAIIGAGRVVEGVPMTRIRGAVFFRDDMIPLTFEECKMREDMVRVGGKGPGTGTADLRYRPEYIGWKMTLRIDYNASVISLAELLNLIQCAGFAVGLCEWRPEKGGEKGRFDLASTPPRTIARAA
jgi:hypothetical protein